MTTLAPSAEPEQEAEAVLYLRVSTKEQAERGGEAEGFSIPAQREAGLRKAGQLSATVVAEFVDAGESARSADRPDLQRMLTYLAEHPSVKYVIVHKIDRLARNRVDDVAINLAIRQAGATLVSCTENIDETPSGMLLHGIMSSIAEFYSRNLAAEVIKGTQQKVRSGGTPSLAPIGYINVRETADGREIRTVKLDPERAEHVRWAFETYATGDWSLNRLAHELEVRGLTQRPTAKRPARSIPKSKLSAILHNPYYVGVVTWRGLQFEGKHPRLVSAEVFAQVQAILEAHRLSGERSYRRKHYLAGTLYCDRCESKLIYSVSTGSRGESYAYWCCLGRHTYKNGCDLPYLPGDLVEDVVTSRWQHERFSDEEATVIRDELLADLNDYIAAASEAGDRLDRRIATIKRERMKWAEKAMAGTVPDDIARDKQQELGHQLAAAQTQRAQLGLTAGKHEAAIRSATALLPTCGVAYQRGGDALRRDYNQAWFDKLYLDDEDGQPRVARADRTDLLQALHTAEVQPEATETAPSVAFAPIMNFGNADESSLNGRYGRFRARVISRVGSSKVPCLVGDIGLEPMTSAM